MKAYIPEEVIEKVRSAFQIEKVIGEFIPLRRAGVNYKCNCPFHKDSNASFTVSPAKDMWKCFGCGEGGNVFTFVQKHEGITFPEAVRLLADRAGIRIPEPEMSDEERAQQRKRQSMEVALNFARDTYRGNIAEPEAEAFLTTRGIPEDILDRYETGYAPGGRNSFLETARSYSHQDHVLMDAGLIGKNQYDQLYDRFQNRIVWPFHSPPDASWASPEEASRRTPLPNTSTARTRHFSPRAKCSSGFGRPRKRSSVKRWSTS
ncbi:hypothetical protein CS387_02965 [Porphyromonas gingivalis]|nr:hypothetical protein CS387_02965 [Porphyromonas gingivalis]